MPTVVTYLQMFAPPAGRREAPATTTVIRLPSPSVTHYRELYNGVGQDYDWTDRNRMRDQELAEIIQHPLVEIHVLQVHNVPAGYCELDFRQTGEVQIAYFGLFRSFLGQGLGSYFLNWALHYAWARHPRRVWVHTCDKDHPRALATYCRSGLEVYDRRLED